LILEINGQPIRYAQTVQSMIKTISTGRLKIKYLRILKNVERVKNGRSILNEDRIMSVNNPGWNDEKLVKAKLFYETVSMI
jgi:hypothetical protein